MKAPRIEWVGEPPDPETLRLWLDLHSPIDDDELEDWLNGDE